MGDINTAIADWKSANYFDFGDQIGAALVTAVGSPEGINAAVNPTPVHFGVDSVVQVVAGLMQGIIQKDDLKEIQQCLTNAQTLETEVLKAAADFSEGSITGIISGIKEIGTVVFQLPGDLS
jgi:hypothetical protein